MTRDEAKSKHCPQARVIQVEDGGAVVGGGGGTHYNRILQKKSGKNPQTGIYTNAGNNCLADDCMMWRERDGEGWCGLGGRPAEAALSPAERKMMEFLDGQS